MEIKNQSPFLAALAILLDNEGAEQLCVTVRGTWDIAAAGNLDWAREPPPISPLDTHWGKPGLSSIKHEADIGYPKRTTDVALVGSAIAPRPDTTRMEVSLRVGRLVHRAVVLGARVLVFGGPTPPRPFDRVPLVWEVAAGGMDNSASDPRDHAIEPRNPLGRGLRAKRSTLSKKGALLPQVVIADGNDTEPVGFGFIAEGWLPRRQYAGTYDDVWRKTRMPILPLDFDDRFHNKAAPGLVAPQYLKGSEPVEVRGCTPGGLLSFALPADVPAATARLANQNQSVPLHLATVTVDCEAMQLRMSWRGALRVHGRLPQFKRLTVRSAGDAPAAAHAKAS